jgi:hypothetical protein
MAEREALRGGKVWLRWFQLPLRLRSRIFTAEMARDSQLRKWGRGAAAMTTKKRWVSGVKTVSTFPPKDLFTNDAETIARVMATKKVSPKGIGSGIRMIQYFINRAGKSLSAARKRELEKAKRLLQERARKQK